MCSLHQSHLLMIILQAILSPAKATTLPKLLFPTSPRFCCCPMQWHLCHLSAYQHWQLSFFFNIPSWWCVKDVTTIQSFVHQPPAPSITFFYIFSWLDAFFLGHTEPSTRLSILLYLAFSGCDVRQSVALSNLHLSPDIFPGLSLLSHLLSSSLEQW